MLPPCPGEGADLGTAWERVRRGDLHALPAGFTTAVVNARPSSCCSCTFAVLLEEPHEVHLVFAEFLGGGSALFWPR